MDNWNSLKEKLNAALEGGNVKDALSHITSLKSASATLSDVPYLLANHTVKELPTLHFLARFPFKPEDIPHLDMLVSIFKNSGYNVNKPTDKYKASKMASIGFTALLASVEQRNVILMDCLLRQGARTNIRDNQGFTPCHWAILLSDLKCLEKLVEFGGPSVLATTSIERNGLGQVHPILHTAVEQGCTEIVSYLLEKEELGVDVNEEAMYEDIFARKMFTAVGRALYTEAIPMIKTLIKYPAAKLNLFRELYTFLVKGDTKKGLGLLKCFSHELSTDKIQDRWSLHTSVVQFTSSTYVEFRKQVVLEFMGMGWNVNSWNNDRMEVMKWSFTKYALLHLACLCKDLEIIKMLVEAGTDINSKTEGEVEMTPLQVLIRLGQWDSAAYLVEKGADLSVRGKDGKFTNVMRRNLTTGNLKLDSTFSSVELLVKMQCKESIPLFEQVLARPDVVWHGANEFHLAIGATNPDYILKVLQQCAKIISKEDLNWITFSGRNPESTPEKVPSLIWLFSMLKGATGRFEPVYVQKLADVIKFMAELGCDVNISSSGQSIHTLSPENAPLIFYILDFDRRNETSNLLLRTILQFDHLQLNVTNGQGLNPVDQVIMNGWHWHIGGGLQRSVAVQLLLSYGLNVSGTVIGRSLTYHQGFKVFVEMLYRAGAKISDEFFTRPPLCPLCCETNDLATEIVKLKKWKEEFDRKTRFSLKHICCMRIRNMLTCVGDLKKLIGMSQSLMETILGTGRP